MNRRGATIVLRAAGCLAVAGCAANGTSFADLPTQQVAGHFVSGPGESWFTPCSASPGDASWWVTVTGRAAEQVGQARAAGELVAGQRYFVRWDAAVATDGRIGPRGPGAPALLVREVLELRAASADDCAGRAP